ncbi:MAG TPA: type II toxin-antitoxin system VapC family toxin [Pirellulaceae bacterium]
MFVFDTDHLGILQRENEPEVSHIRGRMAQFTPRHFFVSIVSFHEQVIGWCAHLSRSKNQRDVIFGYEMFRDVLRNFSKLQVLDYGDRSSQIYLSLKKQKSNMGTMDLRIAAVTLANDMTLLTRNTVDFERVKGLRFEDWTLPK